MSVGYDLYLKLLEEAVLEEKGDRKNAVPECSADLTVSANIPENYVASPEQRMDLYRRIAAIRSDEDSADVLDELIDRYGEPPKSVLALLDVALLRAAAVRSGITDIFQKGERLVLTMDAGMFRPSAVAAVCTSQKYRRHLTLNAGEIPRLTLLLPARADVLDTALTLVEDLRLSAEETNPNSPAE